MNPLPLPIRLLALAAFLTSASLVIAQQAPPESDKSKEVVALVEKAAALINAKGKAAFAEMKANPSEWHPGELYLFAGDLKGKAIYNGGFPKFEGTDTSGLKDSTGKLIVKEQIELAKKSGKGWVHYMWPKAGQSNPLQKWSYIKSFTADGAPGYVGAGFYPE
jgi:signal transduction histidine kinase